jgi:hypothetical protein
MLLRQAVLYYIQNIRGLSAIQYGRDNYICYRDINAFNISAKNTNDMNNKKRENIIGCIIANYDTSAMNNYYRFSRRWNNIKDAVFNYISNELQIPNHKNITVIHKGGRKYNYDFEIISDTQQYNIELKFNIDDVKDAPQFVAPYNPSKYMNNSFEEFYYENYLSLLTSSRDDLVIPTKDIYLHEINSPSPNCMKKYQEVYYNGCKASSRYTGLAEDIAFYKLANKLSSESIIAFIAITELNIDLLNEYLRGSQKDKIYMLYKDGKFHRQVIESSKYFIVSYTKCKKKKNRFVATTQEGKNIKILLRWKNGNGIAFPAFQIS